MCDIQQWADYRVTWNTSDYGDLEFLLVHASKVWKPELLLNNK